jgi:phenylalanyl-tRNA synthetase beta chain
VITYRLTTPQAEARLLGQDHTAAYVTLANPSTPERIAMRHSVLSSVLDVAAENTRHHSRVQLFEVGQIYVPEQNGQGEAAVLPAELRRLAVVLTGPRHEPGWLPADTAPVDFFDLKGVVETLLDGLHVAKVAFEPARHPAYHPGRVAMLKVNKQEVGLLGQLHPLVVEAYGLQVDKEQPVLAADLNLDTLLAQVPNGHVVRSVLRFPPVQQDIALVVDEQLPADRVEALIRQTGQPLLVDVRLFDVYRSPQLGAGKKSLAYSLTFQSDTATLTDKVVARQQQNIVKRLEKELGAALRA